jgi:hypothetical protein
MSETKATCDLCGSHDGNIRKIVVPDYGRVGDIAIQKFPFYKCICNNCKTTLDNLEIRRKESVKKRADFVKSEYARREENHLCADCGGEVSKSGPYMVYEGTYATKYRCKHCGKQWEYT